MSPTGADPHPTCPPPWHPGTVHERTGRSRGAFRGCLLGGAVGDALGAPVEFLSLRELRARHGAGGVDRLVAGEWPAGTITDDTQMTLFTAEALIRALHQAHRDGATLSVPGAARRAYFRWLSTQGEVVPQDVVDGWLVGVRGLHARRAPGGTCLAALREGGWGSRQAPANASKGCGGVMRVAPVGLALPERAFEAGCDAAAITHGDRTGWLAAGFLAQVVADVSRGAGPTPEDVEALGGGWIAEEALAMGLYCTLVARDFAHGVLLAVNHGGDSDSAGAVAGNLLGLVHGEDGIPAPWLERLELRDVVEQVADDLWAHFGDGRPATCDDLARYPPG